MKKIKNYAIRSIPLKIGQTKRVRAVCRCGKRYWTIREIHLDQLEGYWISDSNNQCKRCEERDSNYGNDL